jgi:hypothetical protein
MRAHDHDVVGYSVDGRGRRIILQTENSYAPEPRPRLDVVFVGVEFYQFRFANLVSILAEITEVPLREALETMADELSEGIHSCGWPERWGMDPAHNEARLRELEAAGARFFEIDSAIGLQGWVVASGFDYEEHPPG